ILFLKNKFSAVNLLLMPNVHIQGQMTRKGTKQVAQILAHETGQGLKWLLICAGMGVGFLLLCYGISLIKWW
ncbi:hypothetical protein, partial [Kingella oralis]|uniref:hypothetical protein n=1 Tax=Kingella oralis TaxID=505 RepID=UPI0034E4BB68